MWGGHGGWRLIQTCVEDHGVLPASRQQLEVSEKSFSRQLHVEVGQRQSGRPQHGSVRGASVGLGPFLHFEFFSSSQRVLSGRSH